MKQKLSTISAVTKGLLVIRPSHTQRSLRRRSYLGRLDNSLSEWLSYLRRNYRCTVTIDCCYAKLTHKSPLAARTPFWDTDDCNAIWRLKCAVVCNTGHRLKMFSVEFLQLVSI
jgi:hypothetical protein